MARLSAHGIELLRLRKEKIAEHGTVVFGEVSYRSDGTKLVKTGYAGSRAAWKLKGRGYTPSTRAMEAADLQLNGWKVVHNAQT